MRAVTPVCGLKVIGQTRWRNEASPRYIFLFMERSIGFELTAEMEDYGKAGRGGSRDPMKCLYESDDMNDIADLVCRLVFVSIMQDEVCIVPEDECQQSEASDMKTAEVLCARYASFICRFNANFGASDFTGVCAECVARYRGYWRNLMEEFANRFEDWKRGFEDALILRAG